MNLLHRPFPRSAASVLVCGEALFDLFLHAQDADPTAPPPHGHPSGASPGELRLRGRLGGSPCNVAVGLARLGRRAALFTGLAADALGARLRAAILAEGVDAGACADKPGTATTLSLVAADAAGVPAYAFYGQDGAERALQASDLPALADHCVALHFGSYSLVVEPTGSALLALARRERGRRALSLDPNVRLGVEPDLACWRRRIGEWSALAQLIKVSEEDLQLLYPRREPLAAAEAWLHAGAHLVVVTRGAHGAIGLLREQRIEVSAPQVRVADTVGAGDTFQAALLDGLLGCPGLRAWLGGEPSPLPRDAVPALRAALERAARAAALTCTRVGAQLPYADELDRYCATLD